RAAEALAARLAGAPASDEVELITPQLKIRQSSQCGPAVQT
ncbi:hypothetical protein, partial [Aureimonas populi]